MFGLIKESREALSKVVEALDKEGESRELSLEEIIMRQDALRRIWAFNHMEEISWRWKSRVRWLKEGDKNTRFFHLMASMRSRVNFLVRIRGGGKFLGNTSEIKDGIARFFESCIRV